MRPSPAAWHVLSTTESGYAPIYVVVNGATLAFHCHKSGSQSPFKYRSIENARAVRDRLNDREEYNAHQAARNAAKNSTESIEGEQRN